MTFSPQIVARAGIGAPEIIQQQPGSSTLPQPLIIAPGIYTYNDAAYDMTVEGMYFFMNQPNDGGHRIVFDGDAHTLIASLAKIIVYGDADNGLSQADLTQAARTRQLALQCGPATAFAVATCQGLGIEARTVRALTNEPNGWDEGHVMIEVKIDGAWRLYDLPSDVMMTKADGTPASALDVATTDDWGSEPLAEFEAQQVRDWGGFNPYLYARMLLATPETRDAWQRRIFHNIGIDDADGNRYFTTRTDDPDMVNWVANLTPKHRVLSLPDWTARFYG